MKISSLKYNLLYLKYVAKYCTVIASTEIKTLTVNVEHILPNLF